MNLRAAVVIKKWCVSSNLGDEYKGTVMMAARESCPIAMTYLHALARELVLVTQHLRFGLCLLLMCLVHLLPMNLQSCLTINVLCSKPTTSLNADVTSHWRLTKLLR